ncbi:hypothetical protein [Sporofaciens sp. JLR.KK001]|uniref:hypothetical protein n=1 Tax=Sporofaciens sp. JLR.KK001 TaxID=3112621 RepID=UPI002FF21BBA
MNVKANQTKKQVNVENQANLLLSKEELRKRMEGVEKELNYHRLKTVGCCGLKTTFCA